MFNSKHYTPILKWKRAEQNALKALGDKHKKHITPLIQFVMPRQKPLERLEDAVQRFEGQIPQLAEQLAEVWGNDPIFVDVSLLFTTLKAKSLNVVLRGGRKLGAAFIPVIHLNDDQSIKKIAFSLAKENESGICLRLICPDLTDVPKMNQAIAELVSSSGLERKDIDLLVDIKETEEHGDKYVKYFDLSQGVSQLSKWRTFIFASGSFPEDLSKCKLDEENLLPRIDWTSWRKNIHSKKLQRMPAFADYTIQHPIYKEVSQFFPPTTSIKYTLENEWLIMKGQKQKYDKYLASAAILVGDERFYGENFSDGDKYISEKAKHFKTYIKNTAIKGTGSTETWLRAGINHHLALVAHQVAKLS